MKIETEYDVAINYLHNANVVGILNRTDEAIKTKTYRVQHIQSKSSIALADFVLLYILTHCHQVFVSYKIPYKNSAAYAMDEN